MKKLFTIIFLLFFSIHISRGQDPFSDTMQVLRIPVVFHIFHKGEAYGSGNNIPDEIVFAALKDLNDNQMTKGRYHEGNGYKSKIEFVMASKDPSCTPTNGIVRINASSIPGFNEIGINYDDPNQPNNDAALRDLSRWPTKDYLNIWAFPKIQSVSGALGYAFVATSETSLDNNYYGAVVLNSFGALVHEVAHCMGLFHEDMNCDPAQDIFSKCGILKMRQTIKTYLKPLTEIKYCTPTRQNDAGLVYEENLPTRSCAKVLQPKLTFTNYGSNAITSMEVEMYINGTYTDKLSWSGNLKYDDTTSALFPNLNLTPGDKKIKFLIKKVNGNNDSFSFKDSLVKYVTVAPSVGNLPVSIDFEKDPDKTIGLHTERDSKATFYSTLGKDGTAGLVLEGRTEGGIKHFYAENAAEMFEDNLTYVSEASFCFNAGSTSLLSISYDCLFEASTGGGYTILLNNQDVGPTKFLSGTESYSFSNLNTDLSNYIMPGENIITFKAAISKEQNLENMYLSGGLHIDNIVVKAMPAAPVDLKLSISKASGCVPFYAFIKNQSTGTPAPVEFIWEFEGGTPSTYIGKEPPYVVFEDKNMFDVKLTAKMKDGSSVTKTWKDLIYTVGYPAPYKLDFDTDTVFEEYNIYREKTWVISNIGAYGKSDKSLHLNTDDYFNGGGSIYQNSLTTKPVKISHDKYNLSFDWSQGSWYRTNRDSISISYCTNICSNKWKKLALIPLEEASFIPSTVSYPYTPAVNDWKTKTISLAELAGQDQVYFRIDVMTGFKSLYLDNIAITDILLSTKDQTDITSTIKAFPNPANDKIYFTNESGSEINEIFIYNNLGALSMKADNASLGIDVSSLKAGYYWVVLQDKSGNKSNTSFVKQ